LLCLRLRFFLRPGFGLRSSVCVFYIRCAGFGVRRVPVWWSSRFSWRYRVGVLWNLFVGFSQSFLKFFHFAGVVWGRGRAFCATAVVATEADVGYKTPSGGKSLRRLFRLCVMLTYFAECFLGPRGSRFLFIFGLFSRSFLDHFFGHF